jgi:hypothetical protein
MVLYSYMSQHYEARMRPPPTEPVALLWWSRGLLEKYK